MMLHSQFSNYPDQNNNADNDEDNLDSLTFKKQLMDQFKNNDFLSNSLMRNGNFHTSRPRHHRSSLGIDTLIHQRNENRINYSEPRFLVRESGYGSMIDLLTINGHQLQQHPCVAERPHVIYAGTKNPKDDPSAYLRHKQRANCDKLYLYEYDEPLYSNLDDLLTSSNSPEYENIPMLPTSITRVNSALDMGSRNERQNLINDRFKRRLVACQSGLKELESLRKKHRQMIWQVKNQLIPPLAIPSTNPNDVKKQSVLQTSENGIQTYPYRSPSPTLSSGDSSNTSYRSSVSMDSGWMSMGSSSVNDHSSNHVRTSSIDSTSALASNINGVEHRISYLNRKHSLAAKPNENYAYHAVDHGPILTRDPVPTSGDQGYCMNLINRLNNRLSKSYASIHSDQVTIMNNEQDNRGKSMTAPKPPFRYRRRGLQPPCGNRPKSLYSYPEENTVTIINCAENYNATSFPNILKSRNDEEGVGQGHYANFSSSNVALKDPSSNIYRSNKDLFNNDGIMGSSKVNLTFSSVNLCENREKSIIPPPAPSPFLPPDSFCCWHNGRDEKSGHNSRPSRPSSIALSSSDIRYLPRYKDNVAPVDYGQVPVKMQQLQQQNTCFQYPIVDDQGLLKVAENSCTNRIFTWEEVKLMLDRDFPRQKCVHGFSALEDNRNKASSDCFCEINNLAKFDQTRSADDSRSQQQEALQTFLISKSGGGQRNYNKPSVNRSMSTQSVECAKYKRCKEKLWRESDCL